MSSLHDDPFVALRLHRSEWESLNGRGVDVDSDLPRLTLAEIHRLGGGQRLVDLSQLFCEWMKTRPLLPDVANAAWKTEAERTRPSTKLLCQSGAALLLIASNDESEVGRASLSSLRRNYASDVRSLIDSFIHDVKVGRVTPSAKATAPPASEPEQGIGDLESQASDPAPTGYTDLKMKKRDCWIYEKRKAGWPNRKVITAK